MDLTPCSVGYSAINEQTRSELAYTPDTAGQSESMELAKDVRKYGNRHSGRVTKAKKGLKTHHCECGRVSVSDVLFLRTRFYDPIIQIPEEETTANDS